MLKVGSDPREISFFEPYASASHTPTSAGLLALEMPFEGILEYEEMPTGSGLPIVLKLDNEHEQMEKGLERL